MKLNFRWQKCSSWLQSPINDNLYWHANIAIYLCLKGQIIHFGFVSDGYHRLVFIWNLVWRFLQKSKTADIPRTFIIIYVTYITYHFLHHNGQEMLCMIYKPKTVTYCIWYFLWKSTSVLSSCSHKYNNSNFTVIKLNLMLKTNWINKNNKRLNIKTLVDRLYSPPTWSLFSVQAFSSLWHLSRSWHISICIFMTDIVRNPTTCKCYKKRFLMQYKIMKTCHFRNCR